MGQILQFSVFSSMPHNGYVSSLRLKDENRSINKSGDVSSPISARLDGFEDAESNHFVQDAKG